MFCKTCLQPPIIPKRPLPEDDFARDSESEYDRKKKMRKLDKFREYEDPRLRDERREDEQNVVKSEVPVADDAPSEAVQQLLDEDTSEVYNKILLFLNLFNVLCCLSVRI